MPLFEDRQFKLKIPFEPTGDQPTAIAALLQGLKDKKQAQVLMGVTGSGKTYTMANVIAGINRPTLILCHNKTLAAQLYSEFREFFPENAVEYFVSYYDYYQPEAYIPSTDTFIEKDSQINEEIDKLRHSATRSLLERNDVIIVSSISCIYGLGSPEAYEGMILYLEVGRTIKRQDMLRKLVEIQYKRNDVDFHRGTFRVRGDVVEIFPAHEEDRAVRVEFFGDDIEAISAIDPLRGIKVGKLSKVTIFPGSHYVTSFESRKRAVESIQVELRERLQEWNNVPEKILERARIEQRTMFDIEMLDTMGVCQGIENYSRHLTGRSPGEPPPTLMDYFPKDWLLIVDESHVTVPQIGGMFRGDRARKTTLVEHGFRLPSALDNRPLNFEEWEKMIRQQIYVSATPGDYEVKKAGGELVEQVIRPTGLLDPLVEVRKATTQVDDLLTEIRIRVEKKERVLVTTLTKKLSEDLARYYAEQGVKVKYLHSDIETLERIEILRDLRLGIFDVLIGINLLREGLDLPEVSLVAILDADKEGFLRSYRSLIQTMGRAARNADGFVILYAEKITHSMKLAMDETARRRKLQDEYNQANGITPTTIIKAVRNTPQISDLDHLSGKELTSAMAQRALGTGAGMTEGRRIWTAADDSVNLEAIFTEIRALASGAVQTPADIPKLVDALSKEMKEQAKNLQFERAAEIRDRLRRIKTLALAL